MSTTPGQSEPAKLIAPTSAPTGVRKLTDPEPEAVAPAESRPRGRRGGDGSKRGTADSGGLVVTDANGAPIQTVPHDVADALRFFITRLNRADVAGMPRTIAVTSALSGEGVTFTARSVAAIIAHDLGHSVCVMETNWWRATQRSSRSARQAAEPRPGLAEVLAGTVKLDDVLVRTSDERLFLLPAGQAPLSRRPVIAASDALANLLSVLADTFDTVIVDVPPVLKASEALAICRRCDAAILVIRHGVTTERQVSEAIESLTDVHLLGTVFNRASTRIPRALRRFTVPI